MNVYIPPIWEFMPILLSVVALSGFIIGVLINNHDPVYYGANLFALVTGEELYKIVKVKTK